MIYFLFLLKERVNLNAFKQIISLMHVDPISSYNEQILLNYITFLYTQLTPGFLKGERRGKKGVCIALKHCPGMT